MNNFNAEDYRQPSDTDSHWELKKEFIEMYKYIFDKEKLLCLSQAYCDIVLKKSRYPDPVIKVISELSKPLKMCERFLGNNGNPTVKRPIDEHQKDSEEVNSIYKHSERPFKQMKFLANEEQANSPFLSTSTALQPPVQHFRETYPVPLCNEQSAQIFLKSDQVLKTPLEHSERSFKQVNFSANEGQTSTAFLSTSTDRLQPSMERFSNTYSTPLYNEQGAQHLSISQQTFKTPTEYPEKSFKQANFCDDKRHLSQTILSTFTDVFFPLVEQFRNISSVFLSNEQGAQSLSKSEQAFKAPIQHSERPFKQMDFWADKKQSTSTFLPSSTNLLQLSVEQFKNTYSISSYNEKNFLSLSKSEQTLKVPTENSERPQKQTNLSATKELLSSALSPTLTNVLQSSEEQFTNTYSAPLPNEQVVQILSKSEETVKTSYFDAKRKPKYPFQVKDISITKEKEDMIIKALGLPFIKKFAGEVKSWPHHDTSPLELIHYATVRCNCKREFRFEIGLDPDISSKFYSKFFLKGCLIASETSVIKRIAKLSSAEAAINTLFKLASGKRSSLRSNSMHKHSVNEITDSKKIFEMFSRNINRANNEPAIVTLKNIASQLDMEDYLAFNITSNVVSETETEYTCKFFLNDILVSYATDESIQSAKCVAAELGLIKLANLVEYEIHKYELKKILSHKNKSVQSVISNSSKAKNNLEKPFILNAVLFYSSMRDGMVFLQRDSYQFGVQKLIRDLVSENANFCQKDFSLKIENPTSNSPYMKCLMCIEGKEVGVGMAFTGGDARTIACTKAYFYLKRSYYTLRLKDEYIEGFLVTRDQLFNHEPYSKNVLKKESIRIMKLKHKYWYLDISEKDLSDCVEDRTSSNDTGSEPEKKEKILDLHLFRENLETMLQRFKESEDYCDILFSDDFSSVEKANIIRMVKKLGLRSQSLLHKDSTLVCVRHKYEVRKLLDYLARNGGFNCKFEMLDESETVI